MKNWALAQDLKNRPHKEKQSVDIHYPYGDGINNEDYMPDNLKRAREMANLNRNKLRLINTMGKADGNKLVFRDQVNKDSSSANMMENPGYYDSKQVGRQPYLDKSEIQHQYYQQKSMEHQFSDGKETYHKLRELNYKNAPLTYETNQPSQGMPMLPQRNWMNSDKSPQRNQLDKGDQRERKMESYSHPNLGKYKNLATDRTPLPAIHQNRDLDRNNQNFDIGQPTEEEYYKEMLRREQYLKDLDEQIKKEKELIATLEQREQENRQTQHPDLNPNLNSGYQAGVSTNYGQPFDPKAQIRSNYHSQGRDGIGSVPNAESHDYTQTTAGEYRQYSNSPQPNFQVDQQGNSRYPSQDKFDVAKQSDNNRQLLKEQVPPISGQDLPDYATQEQIPSKEMFRNTDEFNYFNKLSASDKKLYMAAFLRGQKGKEFCLDSNQSERLKKLNDFYEDYLSEQYKRRTPMLPDDYRYRAMVHHLKRNNIL